MALSHREEDVRERINLDILHRASIEERNVVRDVLGLELAAHGFDESSKPNELGVYLESLIDKLGP